VAGKVPTLKGLRIELGPETLFSRSGFCGILRPCLNPFQPSTFMLFSSRKNKKVTFQDEFRALLRKHGPEWDERYVWD